MEPKISKKTVKFQTIDNKKICINAVYEDSLSEGKVKGTVVGFHGCPGSHNDFKYMRHKFAENSIRFIGINYPGFKNTESYPSQNFSNEERQSFTNSLLDELQIQGKIIYLGHSRGCENALITSVQRNDPSCLATIVINPPGLRPHQGIRPFWHLSLVDSIFSALPKFMGDYLVHKAVTFSGFKVRDGEDSFSTLRTANTLYFDKQLPFIEKFNASDRKLVMVYGGKDRIIEREVSEEYLDSFENIQRFSVEKVISEDEKREIMNGYESAKGVAVFVSEDNHFQNKHQAEFISFAINRIFESQS